MGDRWQQNIEEANKHEVERSKADDIRKEYERTKKLEMRELDKRIAEKTSNSDKPSSSQYVCACECCIFVIFAILIGIGIAMLRLALDDETELWRSIVFFVVAGVWCIVCQIVVMLHLQKMRMIRNVDYVSNKRSIV